MRVGFMHRVQRAGTIQSAGGITVAIANDVTAPLRCGPFLSFAAKSPTATPQERQHQQLIIETTRYRRENLRMPSNGGAIA